MRGRRKRRGGFGRGRGRKVDCLRSRGVGIKCAFRGVWMIFGSESVEGLCEIMDKLVTVGNGLLRIYHNCSVSYFCISGRENLEAKCLNGPSPIYSYTPLSRRRSTGIIQRYELLYIPKKHESRCHGTRLLPPWPSPDRTPKREQNSVNAEVALSVPIPNFPDPTLIAKERSIHVILRTPGPQFPFSFHHELTDSVFWIPSALA